MSSHLPLTVFGSNRFLYRFIPGTSCGPFKARAFPKKGKPREPRGTGVGGGRKAASGLRSAPSRVAARTIKASSLAISPGLSFAAPPLPLIPAEAAAARRGFVVSALSSWYPPSTDTKSLELPSSLPAEAPTTASRSSKKETLRAILTLKPREVGSAPSEMKTTQERAAAGRRGRGGSGDEAQEEEPAAAATFLSAAPPPTLAREAMVAPTAAPAKAAPMATIAIDLLSEVMPVSAEFV